MVIYVMNSSACLQKQTRQNPAGFCADEVDVSSLKTMLFSLRQAISAKPFQGHAEAWNDVGLPEGRGTFLFVRNNGIREGFHRKMKLIQLQAWGFKNFENYRLRVRVFCG